MESRLNVPKNELKIFLDDKFTKKLVGKDTDTLKTLKLKYDGSYLLYLNIEMVICCIYKIKKLIIHQTK